MPAAGYLAAYNKISAAYFTLVGLVFRTKLFRVVGHHCKVQIILIIKYYHFSYYVVPLITKFRLLTASLHRFSGYKVSSKLLIQIVTKKYITYYPEPHTIASAGLGCCKYKQDGIQTMHPNHLVTLAQGLRKFLIFFVCSPGNP